MKEVASLLLLLLLAIVPAAAQTQVCGPHPTDPGAVLVGSFTSTVEFSTSSGLSGKGTKKGTKCVVANLICVFRTANGYELVSDPASVTFSGDCATEKVNTAELFDMLGRAAVSDAARYGYVDCKSDCTSKTPVRYLVASCVSRSGMGTATRFSACTTAQCVRAYSVCCPSGALTIEQVPVANSGCTDVPAECQSTCSSSTTTFSATVK